jgi:hypothetical protein
MMVNDGVDQEEGSSAQRTMMCRSNDDGNVDEKNEQSLSNKDTKKAEFR